MEFAAFYEQLDEDTFAPTIATSSPWDERLQHGGPPTALMTHAITARYPRDDVRIARVASEFLGPIPRAPMRISTRVARPGRRIEMIEAAIEIGGREVLVARFWRIAVQPEGSVPPGASAPEPVPRLPEPQEPLGWLNFGYGRSIEWRYVYGRDAPGPAAVWSRLRVPLVEGKPLEPIERAIVVADSANGISGELAMDRWLFVPPSLSLAFMRYPRGEWVLLEAHTTLTSDGAGVTSSRVADPEGYIAVGSQPLYVEQRTPPETNG
jgi:hypothetical protein